MSRESRQKIFLNNSKRIDDLISRYPQIKGVMLSRPDFYGSSLVTDFLVKLFSATTSEHLTGDDFQTIDSAVAQILDYEGRHHCILEPLLNLINLLDRFDQNIWQNLDKIFSIEPEQYKFLLHFLAFLESKNFLTGASFKSLFKFSVENFKRLSELFDSLNTIYDHYSFYPDAIWTILLNINYMDDQTILYFKLFFDVLIKLNALTHDRVMDFIVDLNSLIVSNECEQCDLNDIKSFFSLRLASRISEVESFDCFVLDINQVNIFVQYQEELYLVCRAFKFDEICGFDISFLENMLKGINSHGANLLKLFLDNGFSISDVESYFSRSGDWAVMNRIYHRLQILNATQSKWLPWLRAKLLLPLQNAIHEGVNKEIFFTLLNNFSLSLTSFDFLPVCDEIKEILSDCYDSVNLVCSLGFTIFELAQFDKTLLKKILSIIDADNIIILRYIQEKISRKNFLLILINSVDIINQLAMHFKKYNSLSIPGYSLLYDFSIIFINTFFIDPTIDHSREFLQCFFDSFSKFNFSNISQRVQNSISDNPHFYKQFFGDFTLLSFFKLNDEEQYSRSKYIIEDLTKAHESVIQFLSDRQDQLTEDQKDEFYDNFFYPDILALIGVVMAKLGYVCEESASEAQLVPLATDFSTAPDFVLTVAYIKQTLTNYLAEFDKRQSQSMRVSSGGFFSVPQHLESCALEGDHGMHPSQ